MCCQLSRLGCGAAPAAGAHLLPARQLPKFPTRPLSLGCATLVMAKDEAELGHEFRSGCADGTGTAGSGLAHLLWGQRFWECLSFFRVLPAR